MFTTTLQKNEAPPLISKQKNPPSQPRKVKPAQSVTVTVPTLGSFRVL
jgi:hypothetical protein